MLKWDRETKREEWEQDSNKKTLLTSRGVYSCLFKGGLTNIQTIIYGLPPPSFRPFSGCKYPAQVHLGQLATAGKSLISLRMSAAKGM